MLSELACEPVRVFVRPNADVIVTAKNNTYLNKFVFRWSNASAASTINAQQNKDTAEL